MFAAFAVDVQQTVLESTYWTLSGLWFLDSPTGDRDRSWWLGYYLLGRHGERKVGIEVRD
jgi:hypothetical protein